MSKPINPNEAGNASDNLSYEEFVASRLSSQTEETEQSEETEEETEQAEEVEEVEESTDETESDETEESEDDDESEESPEFDLEKLTPEQIRDLAQKGKSRLLKDLGRFKGEAKVLRQELEALRQQQEKPLPNAVPLANNPFKDLKSVEDIAKKHAEMEKVAEDTDRILDDYEGYGPDDVIELDGKEFTKRQIKAANRNARDAMTKFLPAMHRELVISEQRKAMEAQFEERIPKELPEVADEESEAGKLYKSMKDDPLVAQIREHVPDIAPQLGFILAHAARSLTAGKSLKTAPKPGQAPKVKVPESPAGSAAASSKAKPQAKAIEEAYQRYQKTGSVEDWTAYRSLQKSLT